MQLNLSFSMTNTQSEEEMQFVQSEFFLQGSALAKLHKNMQYAKIERALRLMIVDCFPK